MEAQVPPKRNIPIASPDWFDCLPDIALTREFRVLPNPDNPAPLVDVSAETFRRWGLQGLAPKPVVIGGTRHYRVGEIRRWLRGEWEGVQR